VTGALNTARYAHTATLLLNGKVLVAGGTDGSSALSSTELYDPTDGSWKLLAVGLYTARYCHTATLLTNGTVLVTGGRDSDNNSIPDCQLFDPAVGYWRTFRGNNLITPRYSHTATLLPDGRVLVAGGVNTTNGTLSSAELFIPNGTGGSWSQAADMGSARYDHTATLLPNGTVLVAGGFVPGYALGSSILYAPDSGGGAWTSTGSLNVERGASTATLLPNGEVLVTGGLYWDWTIGGSISSAEVYDSATGIWTTTNSMNYARTEHTATLLDNGQVLVAGGYIVEILVGSSPQSGVELYDPATPTWGMTGAGGMGVARDGHTATLLPDGTVLAAGGMNSSGANSYVELYHMDQDWWDPSPAPLHTARSSHTATLLASGHLLVAGGTNGSGYLPTHYGVEQYNPVSMTWGVPPASCTLCHTSPLPPALDSRPTGHLHVERCLHTATLLPNGKVLVAGGETSNGATNITELFNPATGFWSLWPVTTRSCTTCHTNPPQNACDNPAGHLHTPRYGHTATLMPDGKVLVVGGQNDNGYLMSGSREPNTEPNEGPGVGLDVNVELYDPVTGTWAPPRDCEDCHVFGLFPGNVYHGHPYPAGLSFHTATLLPDGEVLVAGGQQSGTIFNLAMLYDPAKRAWIYTNSMAAPRYGHRATLLTNGKVLVTGGMGTNGVLNSAELFDPASGTWTTASPLSTARWNHTATLLPDGNVLVAGGFDVNNSPLYSSELYNLGLGFNASWQPQITTVASELSLGGNLTLSGSGFRGVSEGSCGGGQDSPGGVPVVQLLSLGNEQTLFLLPDPDTGWSDTAYTSGRVSGFPPGYALVTVFVNGIPSVFPGAFSDPILPLDDIPGTGNIIDISVPVPTSPTLTGLTILTNGSSQFAFTNSVGALFGVQTTTNLALPMTNWTVLGGVTEISLGQFQFTDLQDTNDGQRFYRVFSP